MRASAIVTPARAVEWVTAGNPVPYPVAVAQMETWVDEIAYGHGPERVWLLEHPPLYTAGTSAKAHDLLDARFPVFKSGRGGEYTYHGPGQRVAYVMLDLRGRKHDVRAFVHNLEEWVMCTLAHFGVTGERRPGRIGIWVARDDGREDKIAAIGVRVRHWITFHGIAINVNSDLEHFSGIVPCGIRGEHFGVTSLADLGANVSLNAFDEVLRDEFAKVFG